MNNSNGTDDEEPPFNFATLTSDVPGVPYFITLATFIVVLNLFSLVVFYRIGKYTFSNVVLISLCLSDLISGLVNMPLLVTNLLVEEWPLGDFMCYFAKVLDFSQLPVSNQITLVMALHRFLLLHKPYTTNEKFNKRKLVLIGNAWVGPYLITIVLIVVMSRFGQVDTKYCQPKFDFVILIFYDVVLAIMPSGISVLVNLFNIYLLYRKSKCHIRSLNIQLDKLPFTNHGNSKNVASGITTHKNSQFVRKAHEKLKTRKELKAAVCMLLIVVNIILNEYFFYIFMPIFEACPSCYPSLLYNWANRLTWLFPAINPLILFFFNEAFKKEAICLFKAIFLHRPDS